MQMLEFYKEPAPHLSLGTYAAIGTAFFVFFILTSVVFHWLFILFNNRTYLTKTQRERHLYMSNVVAIPHAFIATVNAVYCTYYIW